MPDQEEILKESVAIGDESVKWAELAEIPMDELDPFRGYSKLPLGLYIFQVKKTEMGVRENVGDNNLTRGTMNGEFAVLEVKSTKKFDGDNENLVGSSHFEGVMIFDAERDFGKWMAIMLDSGFYKKGSGKSLGQVFRDFGESGHKFEAGISHRKDRNDPDKSYAELDLNSVKPYSAE